MAHAKKVNFHFLSPIVFPADFGPGVLGPLALKGQNGQTYNGQICQEPSKNSVKSFKGRNHKENLGATAPMQWWA